LIPSLDLSRPTRRGLPLLLLASLACGRPLAASEEDGGSASEATSAAETTTETTNSDSDSGSSGETGGPSCGDGVVDPGESCDLGPDNAWELAECQPDCTFNECGDGYIGLDEACEPPACSPDCQHPPHGCGNKIYACGDWVDNDQDGLFDLYDPDCLSPCDDDEGAFGFDLPLTGGNPGCSFDCFFDDNTGRGDDMCEWDPRCDPLDPGATFGCDYDPNLDMWCANYETQSPACIEQCLPLVANGCDCFGCCEVGGQFVFLEADPNCSADTLDQCRACTPHPSCFNPCDAEACELCLLGELAPGCAEPSCPEGVQPCTDPYACGEDEFCQTGCCRPNVPAW
jgi:hypothetical protein